MIYKLRGQAAVEFLILLSVAMVLFAIAVNYYAGYYLQSSGFQAERQYGLICRQISDEARNALLMGDYYERDFYLPLGDYSASVFGWSARVEYSGGEVYCPMPANLEDKTLNNGKNTIIYNASGLFFG
jgi:hypothetical protein